MSDHELSDESVDRVLDGREIAGEDGAETVGAAAALFRRASGQATADELDAADATIARFTGLVLEPAAAPAARRLRSVPMPARAAVLIAAATLWSTGVAAAATGHLPHPIQSAVSHTASHVGLNLPGGDDNGSSADSNGQGQDNGKGNNQGEIATTTATTTAPTTTESDAESASATNASTTGGPTTTSAVGASAPTSGGHPGQVRGVGPDPTGPSGDALCKAWNDAAARGKPKNPDAPPWRNLLAASDAAGKSIDDFCGTTTSTTLAAGSAPTSTASTSTTDTTSTSSTQAEGTSNGGNNGGGNGNANGSGNANTQGGGQGNGNGNGNGHPPTP